MMFQEMWGLFFVQASAQLLNFQIVQQTTPRELHLNQYLRQNGESVFFIYRHTIYGALRCYQYTVYGMSSRWKSRKVKMAKVLIT